MTEPLTIDMLKNILVQQICMSNIIASETIQPNGDDPVVTLPVSIPFAPRLLSRSKIYNMLVSQDMKHIIH